MKKIRKDFLVLAVAWLVLAASAFAAPIRVTTWNLEWFPNGTPKELPAAEQQVRIAAAADVLRRINPDIVLLQEVRDFEVCARLGETIAPHTYQVAVCSAFRDSHAPGPGKQQVAILAKVQAQAAWAEPWKSMNGVDPPRGFAFGWFKIGGIDVGVYSLHLKSNLVMHGDKTAEGLKNRLKREVSIEQVLNHKRDVISIKCPAVKSFIVGGDFNTNLDQPEFAEEKTLVKLTEGGFRSAMQETPLFERITHPGKGPYPDTTFDYLFGANLIPSKPQITESDASDHLPVTVDFTPGAGTFAASTPAPPAKAPALNAVAPPAPARPAAAQFVTLTQPVKIKVLYGETVLPRGLKLPIVSRDGQTVLVKYLSETTAIPVSSTDLQ